MSDRCYMEVNCRARDAKRFEELGFHEADSKAGICNMCDEEADRAHCGDMPEDIPYYGSSGEGDSYGRNVFACDGKTWCEVDCVHSGDVCVRVDAQGGVSARDLKDVKEYLKVLAAAKKAMGMKKNFRWSS